MSWVRVSKSNRCTICNRPDWCTVGDFFHCCMRVQSDHPCKNGGWLHPINGERKRAIPTPAPRPVINCKRLIQEWTTQTRSEWLQAFGKQIGMTEQALRTLNCCWSTPHHAWAFPMFNGYGNMVGIRLRAQSGKKFSVTGSHQGLFIPKDGWDQMLMLTEGPTDCAAAIDLGYWAIGRPSCSGGANEVITFVKQRKVRRAVIVSDNDSPGVLGSAELQRRLPCSSCILVLPAKDVRAFVGLGGTKGLMDSMIGAAIWNQCEH